MTTLGTQMTIRKPTFGSTRKFTDDT